MNLGGRFSAGRFAGGRFSGNWSPQSLFFGGEVGLLLPNFDPANGTLFQDSAGTTPVTGVGQPVGRVLDMSGNGNHLVQSVNDDYRPTLQADGDGNWYLDFDGVDDYLSTALDMSGTDEVNAVMGLEKASANTEIIFEITASSSSNPGSFSFYQGGNIYYFRSYGSAAVDVTNSGYDAADKHVMTGVGKISSDTLLLREDGVQVGSSATDQGTGNYSDDTLYLGSRAGASLFFSGKLFGLCVLGRLADDVELSNLEKHFARTSGVSL